jgi:hypothetical protein
MRHRDPHDDPPPKRRPARHSGALVNSGKHGFCHHSAVIDADRWPDDAVLLDLDRKAVCTKCGMIGADVRPNWTTASGRPDRRTVALNAAQKERSPGLWGPGPLCVPAQTAKTGCIRS